MKARKEEIDAVVDGIRKACNDHPQLTIYTPSGRLFLASKYQHWLRLYINVDDECRQYPIDLDEAEECWRGPVATLLQWADDKEDEDAE